MSIKILVASNNPKYLSLVKEAFAKDECDVIKATSMSLALYLAHKNLPDLILSGPIMTDGDGESFYKEIQTQAELSTVPFVFLLGDNDSLDFDDVVTVMPDSLSPQKLLEALMPLIKKRLANKAQREEETPE